MGQVFLSAGIEGWGDRHGRKPGCPQTCMETKKKGKEQNEFYSYHQFRNYFVFLKVCGGGLSGFLSSTYSD